MSEAIPELFDGLRQQEEELYQGLKKVLGHSFEYAQELFDLYETFIQLALKPIAKLDDVHQFPALLHLLQWLKNEAIAGTLMLMRGHITDSSTFNRRSFEICATVALAYRDKNAARRWMEAGTSDQARKDYVKTFPAFRLVKDILPKELVAMYEDDCLDVHPSFFAITKRASLDPDRVHRFRYFDIDEADGYQTFFVMKFFEIAICHGKIMEFLAAMYEPSGHFNSQEWAPRYARFVQRFDELRAYWLPFIQARAAQQDALEQMPDS